MDGNGFTGFNPEVAKKDIAYYYENIEAAIDAIVACTENLFGGLEGSWCSPKALEFSKVAFPELFSTLAYFIDNSYDTYNSLVAAYNIIAAKHGAETITSEDVRGIGNLNSEQIENIMYDEWGGNPYLHAADPATGAVGMNIKAVEAALIQFDADKDSVSKCLQQIPSEIAFYDASGSQQMAFKTNVEKFVNAFSDLFSKITEAIKEGTNTEKDNVALAASQSADTLSA